MLAHVLPVLAALSGATPPATLAVAPSPLAAELSAALREELGPGVLVPASKRADATVRLSRRPGFLDLVVTPARGQRGLRRRIRVEGDDERPALRVAVLLVVGVHERLGAPAPRPRPPPSKALTPTAPRSPPTEAIRAAPWWSRWLPGLGPWLRLAARLDAGATPLTPSGPTSDPRSPPAEGGPVEGEDPAGTPKTGGADPTPAETAPNPPPSGPERLSPAESASSTAAPSASSEAPISEVTDTKTSTDSPSAPAEPRRRRLWLSLGAAGGWWARPGSPTFALQAAGHYDFGLLTGGLRVGVSGLCCHLALPEPDAPTESRVEADPLQVTVIAEARRRLLSAGPVALAPVLGLGVEWTRVQATATAFVGAPVEERRSGVSGLLRVGGLASVDLGEAFAVDLGLGLLIRSPRLVVRLPAPFDTDAPDLDPGPVAPYLELGARFAPF